MSIQERLAAEIEEMESKFAPQVDTPDAEAGENETTVSTPESDGIKATEQVEDAPQKKTRTNWKSKFQENQKRMAGLKASSDSFKYNTRQEMDALKAEIAALKEVPVIKPDVFENVFTDEDTDIIGVEAVDIIKRASEKASEAHVNPLKEEIKRLKSERKEATQREVHATQTSEYTKFTDALTKQVKNWEDLNGDPEFLKYLGEVNESSGYSRGVLLRRAEGNRDVDRVASFMKDYIKSIGVNPKLEDQVGPTGTSTTSVVKEVNGEIIKQSFIDNFEDAVIRGQFKHKILEAEQIQLKIETAFQEGRIDFKS